MDTDKKTPRVAGGQRGAAGEGGVARLGGLKSALLHQMPRTPSS